MANTLAAHEFNLLTKMSHEGMPVVNLSDHILSTSSASSPSPPYALGSSIVAPKLPLHPWPRVSFSLPNGPTALDFEPISFTLSFPAVVTPAKAGRIIISGKSRCLGVIGWPYPKIVTRETKREGIYG